MQFRGGMSELMRQASRMQRKIDEHKAKILPTTVEVKGANDKITVVVTYGRELSSLTVDPEFFKNEDPSLVIDAITGTINAGLKKATEAFDKEMEQATGGMKIPGLF